MESIVLTHCQLHKRQPINNKKKSQVTTEEEIGGGNENDIKEKSHKKLDIRQKTGTWFVTCI